jgi:hypothetical protein
MNIKCFIESTTPFIILFVLALLAFVYNLMIERKSSEAMAGLFIVFPLTAIGVMLAVDFSLKRMLKAKPGWIWLIEIIVMLACVYWWIIT